MGSQSSVEYWNRKKNGSTENDQNDHPGHLSSSVSAPSFTLFKFCMNRKRSRFLQSPNGYINRCPWLPMSVLFLLTFSPDSMCQPIRKYLFGRGTTIVVPRFLSVTQRLRCPLFIGCEFVPPLIVRRWRAIFIPHLGVVPERFCCGPHVAW